MPYKRYAVTPDGISPMSIPGTSGAAWVGDGLTHNESGAPVSGAKDHVAQIRKRRHKLEAHDFGDRWADIEGEGDLAVVTWGSSAAPVREAIARLKAEGTHVRLVVPRLIAPMQKARMAVALAGVSRVLVIEQNDSGQLCGFLRAQAALPATPVSYSRPGPLPFRAAEIHEQLKQWTVQ
jgi:2-oxoglutarate ferredoxin oxidoreductase subunit alpha